MPYFLKVNVGLVHGMWGRRTRKRMGKTYIMGKLLGEWNMGNTKLSWKGM